MNDQFATLDLALIVPSLTNPRKTFNAAKLSELANSITTLGLHQPILVRALPGSRLEETSWLPGTLTKRAVRPTHEIVCGERRYRASQQAKLPSIQVIIRELSDNQVREIQLVENLQRDDLTALEEAEGYADLMAHSDLNADQLGDKVSKSRSYIYNRLKLLDLSDDCKQALRDGKLDTSRALLIARCPSPALQAKALAEATRIGADGDVPSVRSLQTWLMGNVMLRLEHAPFSITDKHLVKACGSCKECPKRTGANPDLFAEIDSADVCTDPPCYKQKAEAHAAALQHKAETKGMELIAGKDAQRILNRATDKINGYLPLSQIREDVGSLANVSTNGKPVTLRDLLGKSDIKTVLIEHPTTKELIEAVPTEEAEAMLVVKGLIKATQKQQKDAEDLQIDIEYLQGTIKVKTNRAVRGAQYDTVVDAIRATPDDQAARLFTGDVLREWFMAELGYSIEPEDMARYMGYEFADGVDEMDAISMHIRASSAGKLLKALAIYMAQNDRDCGFNSNPQNDPPILMALAASTQISWDQQVKDAKAAEKAALALEVTKHKAEIKALTAPKATPAATAAPIEGVGGASATKPAKTTPARKPKLSAAEATSGIAAAMQSAEQSACADALAQPETSQRPLGIGLALGQRVKVAVGKFTGKGGEVVKDLGDDCYNIKIDGRSVTMAFRLDQLEVMEVAAA